MLFFATIDLVCWHGPRMQQNIWCRRGQPRMIFIQLLDDIIMIWITTWHNLIISRNVFFFSVLASCFEKVQIQHEVYDFMYTYVSLYISHPVFHIISYLPRYIPDVCVCVCALTLPRPSTLSMMATTGQRLRRQESPTVTVSAMCSLLKISHSRTLPWN